MDRAVIVSVKKESTIADFVKNSFVVPKTGSRVAIKEAAAALAAANPQLDDPKKAPLKTRLLVPPDFPLKLRREAAPAALPTPLEAIRQLKSALPEMQAFEDQQIDAAIARHEETLQTLDAAGSIGEGSDFSERIESIRIAAGEALHQAEADRNQQHRHLAQLDAALNEMIEFLGSSG